MRDTGSDEVRRHLTDERQYYEQRAATWAPLRDTLPAEATARVGETARRPVYVTARDTFMRCWARGEEHGRIVRDADGEVLLDLDVVAAESGGAHLALGTFEIDPAGGWLAWSVDTVGDEAYVLRFRDLDAGADTPVRRAATAPGGGWEAAAAAFYYVTLDATARPWQVWRHRPGSGEPDECLLSEADQRFRVSVRTSADRSAVLIHSRSRDTSEAWYVPAGALDTTPRSIGGRRRGVEYSAEPWRLRGRPGFLLLTDDGAPEFRLMWVDAETPGAWVELRPEQPGVRVLDVTVVPPDAVVLTERAGGARRLTVLDGDDLAAPGHRIASSHPAGTVTLDPPGSGEVCVRDESYVHPPSWCRLRVPECRTEELHRTHAPGHDATRYPARRVSVEVPGRAPVPATVIAHRDTPMDGTAPALIYGYGAYELVFEPYFDPSLPSLLDRGVVFVHAHVRGGGEQGRSGWQDGRLGAKHHSFDDLLTVADGISDGDSVPCVHVDGTRLFTRGMSAGGLLVAAVMSRRPERWRGVLAEVPFVDVVNSMSDPTIPLIVNEYDEWGDPADPLQFGWMRAYSPYENLPAAGQRPDLLVTGSVHDTRVLVHEPAKWVAALRHSDPAWAHRCLFRCETAAGSHDRPVGRLRRLEYEAELQAWLLSVLELR